MSSSSFKEVLRARVFRVVMRVVMEENERRKGNE